MNVIEKPNHQISLTRKKNVTEEQLEALYHLATELYCAECYNKAADLFRLLCFYKPEEVRAWVGLGGSHQRIGNHKAALSAFMIASSYDPQSPEPRLYAAHSLIDLENLPLALESAQAALRFCRYRSDQDHLRLSAELLCLALKNYLNLHS